MNFNDGRIAVIETLSKDDNRINETKFSDRNLKLNVQPQKLSTPEHTTFSNDGSTSNAQQATCDNGSNSDIQAEFQTKVPEKQAQLTPSLTGPERLRAMKQERDSKRERKTAKILVIITGVFIVCWLPFFVATLVMAICEVCRPHISDTLFEIFLWLGYANSLLNPVIYTIFSPDFRNAFRKMLTRKGRQRR